MRIQCIGAINIFGADFSVDLAEDDWRYRPETGIKPMRTMTGPEAPVDPGRGGVSRRALMAAAWSLAALRFPGPALAAPEDVFNAIAMDFDGVQFDAIADGNVVIDTPDYSDSGRSVPLSVTVPCTMAGLDYPEVVAVYATRNPRPRILKVYFSPANSEATFSTRVRIDSYQEIIVVVKMADGRLFKGLRKVDVTFGACEDAIANDQFPPGWAPRIRISVPTITPAGEAAEIRTIIGHPMENGFRHNSRGLLIPVRIVEQFSCFADRALVFSVKLEPAIAANPYFAFNLRLERTTQLRFEWVDTTSEIYSDEATILVN